MRKHAALGCEVDGLAWVDCRECGVGGIDFFCGMVERESLAAVVHACSTNVNRKLPHTTHTYYTLVDLHSYATCVDI